MPPPLSRGPRAIAEDHRNLIRAWFRACLDPKRADGKGRRALLKHLRAAIAFLGPVPEEKTGRRPMSQGLDAVREDIRALTRALDRARVHYPKRELIEHLKEAITILVSEEREDVPVRDR